MYLCFFEFFYDNFFKDVNSNNKIILLIRTILNNNLKVFNLFQIFLIICFIFYLFYFLFYLLIFKVFLY